MVNGQLNLGGPSMVIMVTGGSGLVGKAMQLEVEKENRDDEKWIFLSSENGDLTEKQATESLFKKYRPTHVIHLAAAVGGLYANLDNNLSFLRRNILINDNVLSNGHKYGVKKIVSCLSTCIFPDKTTYPIDETMIHDGPPHESNFGYAYAKRMVDVMNAAYRRDAGCHFTSVIPTGIYGPHDNFNVHSAHLPPAIIHKTYLAKLNNEELVICGSGKAQRQFMYSKDLARLMIWVLHNYEQTTPLILSVDVSEEITVKQLAETVMKVMNFNGKVRYDDTKEEGQFKKTATNRKLRSLYPEFKFTPLDQAIRETVDWFEKNYEIARK